MNSRRSFKAIQPVIVLALGTFAVAGAMLLLFPARGMDMDEQATLQCPAGYVAVAASDISGLSVERIAQPLQTPEGERVCVVPQG